VVVPQTSLAAVADIGTRALRFVASACIPTGKLQRKRRHVSARILQYLFYRIESKTAQPEHYRQAKVDSQNLFNISTGLPAVNYLGDGSGFSLTFPTLIELPHVFPSQRSGRFVRIFVESV
jgi:hypothetical protein